MLKQLALTLLLAAVIPISAIAQFIPKLEEVDTRDQAVIQTLMRNITIKPNEPGDHMTASLRQGPGYPKPLGQYLVQPNTEFKSDYKNVPPEIQVKFAYDLHEHLKNAGFDWPTVHKQYDFKFMPYEKQREWSEFWWLRNYPAYKDLGFLFKDGFLHDSIIDATNVYGLYGRKAWSSADYVIFEDASVAHVVKKQ